MTVMLVFLGLLACTRLVYGLVTRDALRSALHRWRLVPHTPKTSNLGGNFIGNFVEIFCFIKIMIIHCIWEV